MSNLPKHIYIPANTGMLSASNTTATAYMQNGAINLADWINQSVANGLIVVNDYFQNQNGTLVTPYYLNIGDNTVQNNWSDNIGSLQTYPLAGGQDNELSVIAINQSSLVLDTPTCNLTLKANGLGSLVSSNLLISQTSTEFQLTDNDPFFKPIYLPTLPINKLLMTDTDNGVIATSFSPDNVILQDGNSFGANMNIGTNDNFPLVFETNSVEKMRLMTTGGLAIGKTTVTSGMSLDTLNDVMINGIRIGKGNSNISTNTAIGTLALNANTTGNNNVAIGTNCMQFNSAASFNIAIGSGSMESTSGAAISNIAIGYQSLRSGVNVGNIAIGHQSLYSSTGSSNTAVGSFTGFSLTSGQGNTFIGENAGRYVTTGSNNILIGRVNNSDITTGSGNVVIGHATGYGNISNTIIFSNGAGTIQARVNSSNQFTIGEPGTIGSDKLTVNGSIGSTTSSSITVVSDRNEKENIAPYEKGLSFLTQIEPVTFKYKGQKETRVGIIAQDIESILPETIVSLQTLGFNEEGEEIVIKETKAFSGTSDLIYLLINSVKELTNRIEVLEASLK